MIQMKHDSNESPTYYGNYGSRLVQHLRNCTALFPIPDKTIHQSPHLKSMGDGVASYFYFIMRLVLVLDPC